jgi:hypothetical protein
MGQSRQPPRPRSALAGHMRVTKIAHACIHTHNKQTYTNGRHVWVKVVSPPELEVLPLSMRVDETYLRYPSVCTSQGSICTNTLGSHTCTCKPGFVLSGTECVKDGTSGSFLIEATPVRVFEACPPGALSKPGAKALTDCYCPAGHYRNDSKKGLSAEEEACVPCPAGTLCLRMYYIVACIHGTSAKELHVCKFMHIKRTCIHTYITTTGFWADEGSDTCTKCPTNSWSMPNTTLGTKGCFCDPGFFWDWYPEAPNTNEEANFTCVSLLTLPCPGDNGTATTGAAGSDVQTVSNSTAGNSSKCVLYVNVTKRGRDCPGFKPCKEVRGTPENPCVRCPRNSDSPAGSGSRADCFCQVRDACV